MVNGTDHPYGFQDQEEQDELGLGWIQFKWRNHDPAIGRFFNVDPLAEDYVYNGVYNFSENRVIDGVELEGLEWQDFRVDQKVERMSNGERTTKTEALTGLGLAAAGVLGVATLVLGPEVVGTFIANEVKDEALSYATGGASDVIDVTKGIKNLVEFGAEKLAKNADDASTTVYRAVSDAELDDISGNGFRVPENTLSTYDTGKLFTTSAEDAAQFGKNNFKFDGIPNTVVKAKVPNSTMKNATQFTADQMPAVSIPKNQLNTVFDIKPLDFSPITF